MAAKRQTSFGGGEFSPLYWGRTDLGKYETALRTCRNFFIGKGAGMAISRPGTVRVADCSPDCRLVPFVFSDSQSFVVEVNRTPSAFRFYKDGAIVETAPGVPYVLNSPFSIFDVRKLQWAQVGDIITFTNGETSAYELRRYSDTNWTISTVSFAVQLPWFYDIDAPGILSTFKPAIVQLLPTGVAPAGQVWAADDSHPAREWIWKVTVLAQDPATGRIFETLPATVDRYWDGVNASVTAAVTSNHKVVLYPDRTVTLKRAQPSGMLGGFPGGWVGPQYRAIAHRYYRGRGNLFGFIGETKGREFVDDGSEPDYSIQPPRGTNPFELQNANFSVTGYEYPKAVTFFESRRVFAGTDQRPGFFFPSATDDYTNFDKHTIPVSGEALEYELATPRREDIVSMVGLKRLIILTNSSWFTVGGVQGPLDFDSIQANREEGIGAKPLMPLVVGSGGEKDSGLVLFARAKGTGVRGIHVDQTGQSYSGSDLSVYSEHLFKGRAPYGSLVWAGKDYVVKKTIRDWAYAEDPWGVVWVVREDGALLSFTPGAGGGAWARHDTAGVVQAVCSVPEGDEDAIYLVVTRQLHGGAVSCVERMASRVRQGIGDDDCCVDSAAKIKGATALTYESASLLQLVGKSVYWTAVNNDPLALVVEFGSTPLLGKITLPELPRINSQPGEVETVTMYVGLTYTPEIELLDLANGEARMKQKLVKKVGFEVDQSRGLHVGETLTGKLTEWTQRRVADSYLSPSASSELVRQEIFSTWNEGGRACVRQTLPLPTTLLGITRVVDFGGD